MNKEEHKKHFTGWWIPIYVVSLLENKQISKTEVLLIAMIQSLVNEELGIGCFSSNEYLGEKLGVKGSAISKSITKLKKLDILIQIGFDGRKRYLVTCFNNVEADVYKRSRQTSKKGLGRLVKKDKHIYKEDKRRYNHPADGECFDGLEKKRTKISKPKGYSLAIKLKKILSKHRKLVGVQNPNLTNWSKHFKNLLNEIPKKEILQTLQWYDKHLKDKFVPKTYAAKTFCEKYVQIREAMERSDDSNSEGLPNQSDFDKDEYDMAMGIGEYA